MTSVNESDLLKIKEQDLLAEYGEMNGFFEVTPERFDQSSCYDEDTPLHIAAYSGEVEKLKIMLQTGVDINVRGDIGNTPLHYASMQGHVSVLRLLLENGADPSIVNDYEDTVASFASEEKKAEISKLLSPYQSDSIG